MKGFAGQNLQAFEINFVPAIEFYVAFGKIIAHDADHFHRAEKAGRDRRMAGRAAEQPGIFCLRSFDGIQRGRTDD